MVRKVDKDTMTKAKARYDAHHFDVQFEPGQTVLLYQPPQVEGPKKLLTSWQGPFNIVEKHKTSAVTYWVENPDDGRRFLAHVQNLLPFKSKRLPEFKEEPEGLNEDDSQERENQEKNWTDLDLLEQEKVFARVH